MSPGQDTILFPPADTTVALTPQRVISVERLAAQREHKRARKAQAALARVVGERDIDQRIMDTQAESIRRWGALHAAAEARVRRWQMTWAVTIVLALGYVLLFVATGH